MSNENIDKQIEKFFDDYASSKKNLRVFFDFELDAVDIGNLNNFEVSEPVKAEKPMKKTKRVGINIPNKKGLF